jgi:hypothetical protein
MAEFLFGGLPDWYLVGVILATLLVLAAFCITFGFMADASSYSDDRRNYARAALAILVLGPIAAYLWPFMLGFALMWLLVWLVMEAVA